MRCINCRMHSHLCVCALIPSLKARTRIVVVMHHREQFKTTATAHLVAASLSGAVIHVRGGPWPKPPLPVLVEPGRRSLVLFPGDGSERLTPEFVARDPRPITLIVPDGTWRQARKLQRKEANLRDLPQIRLVEGTTTRYGLRKPHVESALCTLQAVAEALMVIEPELGAERLLKLLDELVEATLTTRGRQDRIPPPN